MTSAFEDSVLDFDINLFQQTSNNAVVQINKDKVRKAIFILKRKIISTNSLIRKFYDKRLGCRALEKCLLTSKEEYKQACIESMDYREKCAALEEEIKKLQSSNLELEQKCTMANNRYDGMQSHAKQLQQLVKENETQIESLKIEQKLEKANSKEQDKKFANLQREQELLIKNINCISEVVLGKKRLTKELKVFLTKYRTSGDINDCDSGEHSCDEADSFHTPMSPLSESGGCNEEVELTCAKGTGNSIEAKLDVLVINADTTLTREDNDRDSECSNEVVSLDTGRGSSLAFSDSDKCFNSPEYFSQHSPLAADSTRNKDKVTIDIATSPIPIKQFVDVATSPVVTGSLECLTELEHKSPSHTVTSCSSGNKNESSSVLMIDRVVSPIIIAEYMEKSTSPIKKYSKEIGVGTSPFKLDDKTSDCCSNNDGQNIQEKECLELNNSICMEDECSNDGEIQMILDTMRFSKRLITPLPTTPAKSRSLPVAGTIATQTVLNNSTCPDAAKLREENITLQETVAKLANDILNINNFLSKLNPLINNDALMETKGTSIDNVAVVKETKSAHCQELKRNFVQKAQELPSGIEKLDFKDKKSNLTDKQSKLKKLNSILFDDSSPPSPNDNFLPPPSPNDNFLPPPSRAPKSLFSPTPPLCPSPLVSSASLMQAVSPPPPRVSSPAVGSPPARAPLPPPPARVASPPPPARAAPPPPAAPRPTPPPLASPQTLDSLRLIVDSDHTSFDDDYEDKDRSKTKERLQFEDPLSNPAVLSDGALSDEDIYEHHIVIELGPDCPESDTNSIHEILKEQKAKEGQQPGEDRTSKRLPKVKKATKLEKLRKKMTPKGKIKKVDIVNKRKRRVQPKRLTTCKDDLKSDSAVNNKTAYEKACKVMAEINSKENAIKKTPNAFRLPVSRIKNARITSDVATNNSLNVEKNMLVGQNPSVVHDKLYEKPYENSPASLTKLNANNKNNISKTVLEPLKGCQRTIRTRSQNRSISVDHSDDISASQVQGLGEKEVTRLDNSFKPDPLSPSQTRPLKMYGRIRDKNVSDNSFTNERNTSVSALTKPCFPAVAEVMKSNNEEQITESRRNLKRPTMDQPDVSPKRMLRSSAALHSDSEVSRNEAEALSEKLQTTHDNKNLLNYGDLDMFDESTVQDKQKCITATGLTATCYAQKPRRTEHPKYGILCSFLEKYGAKSYKNSTPKLSEITVDAICKKLGDEIAIIQKLTPKDTKEQMDLLVQDLKSWNQIQLLSGLIKYLKDPARKIELYNKVNVPPAPPMTKTEQILIYIVSQLKLCWPDIVDNILKNIEYSLFLLNRTPDFEAIETLSHFYAILCRYDKNRNRLRLFIIDAMYCLQFKAVPLIKQCLEVWMHILPLAHMGIAKNPLVTCLVYLLHFYKCEDKFNRVQEIRNILNRKYFYDMAEWNETRILEMFRTCIIELRDIAVEKKMLRIALIILAKRHGARWCQNFIVKNMLLPIIEQAGVSDRAKCFCVALLGPLLKPYPVEMKVNCEVVMNQLSDMLNRNPSKQMEEAIFTSLIYMSRHNQNRVTQTLLFWKPDNVSPELHELLKNYVKEKPVRTWKTVLSRIPLNQT